MRTRILTVLAAWLAVCAWLALGKLALALMPPINIPLIRSEFATSTIAVYGGIGLVGALLSVFAGFAPPLGGGISAHRRFAWPLAVGVALGALAVVIDRFTQGAAFIARVTGEPTFNVDFPQSLPVYLTGAVLPEVVYHILPLSLAMAIVALIRRKGLHDRTFLVLAALAALIEPLLQGGGMIAMAPGNAGELLLTQFVPYFVTSYPMNLAACLSLRRSGFLSPIAVRMGFYAVWHIAYGNFLY